MYEAKIKDLVRIKKPKLNKTQANWEKQKSKPKKGEQNKQRRRKHH